MNNTERLLSDALIKGLGYTREAADHTVIEYRIDVLEDSDHEAYRILADNIRSAIREDGTDPCVWTAGRSELSAITLYVLWLPDMIKHQTAGNIYREWINSRTPGQWEMASKIADSIDPFERSSGGQWIRKSDGLPVPWPIVRD
jgi:hypothetical protein